MKFLKKIRTYGILLGIVGVLAAGSLTACGKKSDEEDPFTDDLEPLTEEELKEIEEKSNNFEGDGDMEVIPEEEMLEEWEDSAPEDSEEPMEEIYEG